MNENFLKLTNTTYQLLEYFPESDLLKPRAKEKVLEIMENLVLIDTENFRVKNNLAEDIEILLGYLKIGKSHGWVSAVNYLIVSNEYRKIADKNAVKEAVIIEEPQEKCTQLAVEPVLDKSGTQKKESHNFVKLSERQQKIVKFLEDKERAQVMDLQAVLPTVTKRTIRRDLDELLSNGKIVRMGEFNQVFYRVGTR